MLRTVHGNILDSNAQVLTNPVNCVGIMGKGIALEFKNKYPNNYKNYAFACNNNMLKPGNIHIFEFLENDIKKFIINFPTKRHWKDKSKIEDIYSGMLALSIFLEKNNIQSIAIPKLGCGLGGLNWFDVRNIFIDVLTKYENIDIQIFE